MPSIKFKNHAHEETTQTKKETRNVFYSPFNITKILPRWVLKEPRALLLFVRAAIRERRSEVAPKAKLKKFKKKGGEK